MTNRNESFSMAEPSGRFTGTVIVATILTFILLSLLRAGQWFSQDETTNYQLARSIAESGVPLYLDGHPRLWSPPLYVYLLGGFLRMFGETIRAASLLGILLLFSGGIFALKTLQNLLAGKPHRGRGMVILAALFFLNPAFIQGAVIKDIDNSLLVCLVSLFCMVFTMKQGRTRLVWLGLIFFLLLWTKLTTPFLILPAIFLAGYFSSENQTGTTARELISLLFGALLFFLGYVIIGVYLKWPWEEPFLYLVRAFAGRVGTGGWGGMPGKVVYSLVFLFLWTGILSPILFLKTFMFRDEGGRLIFRANRKIAFLAWFSLLSLAVYTFVLGGAAFGFPKYYLPGLVPLYILVAYVISRLTVFEGVSEKCMGYGMGLLALLVFSLAGDPVHWIKVDVKSMRVFREYVPALSIFQAGVYLSSMSLLAFFAGRLIFADRKKRLLLVFIIHLSSCLALGVRQSFSGYNTGYSYGDRKTGEIVKTIRDQGYTARQVLAPTHILFWSVTDPVNVPDRVWEDKREFLERIRDESVKMVVFSLGHNTVGQLRRLLYDEEIRSVLTSRYEEERVGTWWVYKRNHF